MNDLDLKRRTIRLLTGPMGSGKSRKFKEIHKNSVVFAKQPTITINACYDQTAPPKTIHSRDSQHYYPIDYNVSSISEIVAIVRKYLDPINIEIAKLTADLYISTNSNSFKNVEIENKIKECEKRKNLVVLVDECQFLDKEVPYLHIRDYLLEIRKLADEGPQFFFFGLDMTYERKSWKTTALIGMLCWKVIKLSAICRFCGKSGAEFSKCIDEEVLKGSYVVSDKEIFFASCIDCYNDNSKREPIPEEEMTLISEAIECR